jgi:hypothetical protein
MKMPLELSLFILATRKVQIFGNNLNKSKFYSGIKSRLKPGNACCHSAQNLLSSSLLSKNLKIKIQWNLDLSFFKGMEKTNDECGKTINTGNYYTHCK